MPSQSRNNERIRGLTPRSQDKFHSPDCYDIGPYHSTHAYVLGCYDKEIYYYTHAPDSDIDEG